MDHSRNVLDQVLEMFVDNEEVNLSDRPIMTEMYRRVVTLADDWRSFLDQHERLLDVDITIEHSTSCSCGRFFEQHPTTIDGVEGELLQRVLTQIEEGSCACLRNMNPNYPVLVAAKPARKTLLHAAAASGYHSAEVVQYLLEKKCIANKVTSLFSYTPLFRAVCSKADAVVSTLVAHVHTDVNMRSRRELHTPLVEAICNRYYPVVDLLLAVPTVDLTVCNFRSETPVIVAARMGELKVLEKLLQMGADPNACDQRGMTALMFSVLYGLKKVTRLLLSYNADMNMRTNTGESPLLLAISSDSYEVTRILLEAGANVNDVSDDGYPALMMATYSNYANVVQLLLDYDVDVHSTNSAGYQAIHIAAWNGYISILLKLLSAGAEADVRTNDRNTPLSLAAHGNHFPVVEILMARGCNINNADKDLDTPLHYASFNGNATCVERLLESGADPEALNRLQVTPLWNAVYCKQFKVIKILLKYNVALSVPTQGIEQHAQSDQVITVFDTPRTPLWVAANHGSAEMALLLITAGCDISHEHWVGMNEFPGKSQNMQSLKDVLAYYYSVPRPLMFQCRIALRRMAGHNVRRFVQRLNVPQKFRNFINLSDVLD